ncbi:MAG: response regulator transcription factor [Bacteroidota bacterium]
MIRLGIIEDDKDIRTGFERYLSLQPDISCEIVSDSVEAFFEELPAKAPLDVVLTDIGLPGKSGIEGIPLIKKQMPHCNILMITVYNDQEKIFMALCAGATGYLLKNTPLSKVREAILNVHNGDAAMSPSIARKVIAYFQPRKAPNREQLTSREQQIVQAIVDGLSYKMIANRLNISFETVKQHIKNIYKKLQINSKAELISRSYRGEI